MAAYFLAWISNTRDSIIFSGKSKAKGRKREVERGDRGSQPHLLRLHQPGNVGDSAEDDTAQNYSVRSEGDTPDSK